MFTLTNRVEEESFNILLTGNLTYDGLLSDRQIDFNVNCNLTGPKVDSSNQIW